MAGVRFPGLEDIPAGFGAWGALADSADGQQVLLQFFATVMMMHGANQDHKGTAEFPGDYRNGFIDFGWDKQTDAWKKQKRSVEINNGRAAQMGILGLMVHEQLGASILPGGILP